MEADIKRCEELIKEEHANWIGISNQKAIENLIKGYRKLERTVKIKNGDIEWMQNKINKHFIDDVTLQRDYIPKSKVKEKIEELKKELNNGGRKYGGCSINPEKIMKLESQIDILQELMEE